MSTPQNSDEVAAAIRPTLDRFVEGAKQPVRAVVEQIYEGLLYSVQDYLRDNAEWNLAAEIDRCRRIEADNRVLRDLNAELLDSLDGLANALRDGLCNSDLPDFDPDRLDRALARALAISAKARGAS